MSEFLKLLDASLPPLEGMGGPFLDERRLRGKNEERSKLQTIEDYFEDDEEEEGMFGEEGGVELDGDEDDQRMRIEAAASSDASGQGMEMTFSRWGAGGVGGGVRVLVARPTRATQTVHICALLFLPSPQSRPLSLTLPPPKPPVLQVRQSHVAEDREP